MADESAPKQPEQMLGLADLIQSLKGGRSYEVLAALSGGLVNAKTFQAQGAPKTSPTNLPDAKTMRGIAVALGVSERAVLFAAARSAGFDVDSRLPRLADRLPVGVDGLDEDDKRAVLRILGSLAGRRELEGGDPEPRAGIDVDMVWGGPASEVRIESEHGADVDKPTD